MRGNRPALSRGLADDFQTANERAPQRLVRHKGLEREIDRSSGQVVGLDQDVL